MYCDEHMHKCGQTRDLYSFPGRASIRPTEDAAAAGAGRQMAAAGGTAICDHQPSYNSEATKEGQGGPHLLTHAFLHKARPCHV